MTPVGDTPGVILNDMQIGQAPLKKNRLHSTEKSTFGRCPCDPAFSKKSPSENIDPWIAGDDTPIGGVNWSARAWCLNGR
jgi:hypothetical protein